KRVRAVHLATKGRFGGYVWLGAELWHTKQECRNPIGHPSNLVLGSYTGMLKKPLLSLSRLLCCCSCSWRQDQRSPFWTFRLQPTRWAKPLPSPFTYTIHVAFAASTRSSSRMVLDTKSLRRCSPQTRPTPPGTSQPVSRRPHSCRRARRS